MREPCALKSEEGDVLVLPLTDASDDAVAEADEDGVGELAPSDAVAGAVAELSAEADEAAVAVAHALPHAEGLAVRLSVGVTLAVAVSLAAAEAVAQSLAGAEKVSAALPEHVADADSEPDARGDTLERTDPATLRVARAEGEAVGESVRVAVVQLLTLALEDSETEAVGEIDADAVRELRGDADTVASKESVGRALADAAADSDAIEADDDPDEDSDGVLLTLAVGEVSDNALAERRGDGEPRREMRALGDVDSEGDCEREERGDGLVEADMETDGDSDIDDVDEWLGCDAVTDAEPQLLCDGAESDGAELFETEPE